MGCIDSMMNVVVPFIYSHMKVESNYIRADKEVGYNIVFESPEYASYYFNQYVVPVIYSTFEDVLRKQMYSMKEVLLLCNVCKWKKEKNNIFFVF